MGYSDGGDIDNDMPMSGSCYNRCSVVICIDTEICNMWP